MTIPTAYTSHLPEACIRIWIGSPEDYGRHPGRRRKEIAGEELQVMAEGLGDYRYQWGNP